MASEIWSATSAGTAIALDSFGNATGDRITEVCGLHAIALPLIADKSAFHKNRRQLAVPDHVEPRELGAAIDSPGMADQTVLHVVRKALPLAGIIKSFQAAHVFLPRVVEVHTHKDRIAVAVGNAHPLGQGDEVVTAACQNRLISHLFEMVLKADRGVQGEVLLVDAPPLATVVMATVAGIDHDSPEIGSSGEWGRDAHGGEGKNTEERSHGMIKLGKPLGNLDIFKKM